jgi:mycothiol system anti-sigma-R factor
VISCHEAVERLWEYLDGRIPPDDRARLEAHLALCRRCCGELEFARELRGFLTRSADEDVPDDVLARLNTTLEELET